MVSISVEQFENDPKGLLAQVAAGERILVKRGDTVVAELGPAAEVVQPEMVQSVEPRPIGLGEGDFVVPDDFDAPLPEDLLRLFDGG